MKRAANELHPNELLNNELIAKDTKIKSFLQGLPSLIFSETGSKNICKRFDISVDQLQGYIQIVTDEQKKQS